MGRPPLSPTRKGMVQSFLRLNFSTTMIMKEMRKANKPISRGSVSNIKTSMDSAEKAEKKVSQSPKKEEKKEKKVHKFKKLSLAALRKLDRWTNLDSYPTQETMAGRLNVSTSTIRYHIKNSLKKNLKKKKLVHTIYKTALEKRRKRSWKLYRSLANGRYKDVITTDEAWFYLKNTGNKRNSFYHKVFASSSRSNSRNLFFLLSGWNGIAPCCSTTSTVLTWINGLGRDFLERQNQASMGGERSKGQF